LIGPTFDQAERHNAAFPQQTADRQPDPRAKLYTIPTIGSPIRQHDGALQKGRQGNTDVSAPSFNTGTIENGPRRSRNGLALDEAVSQLLNSDCRRSRFTLVSSDWPNSAKLQNIFVTDAARVFIV